MHVLGADLAIQLPQDRVMFVRAPEKSARQILVNVDVVSALAEALRQLAESIALAAKALPPRAGSLTFASPSRAAGIAR
jgi:hypothetical protein